MSLQTIAQEKLLKCLNSKNVMNVFSGYEIGMPRHIFLPNRKGTARKLFSFILEWSMVSPGGLVVYK